MLAPRATENFELDERSPLTEDITSIPADFEFTPSNSSASSAYNSRGSSTNGSQSSRGKRKKGKDSAPTPPWLLKAQVWAWDKFLLFQILILMTVEPLIMKHASPEDLERERERREAAAAQQ